MVPLWIVTLRSFIDSVNINVYSAYLMSSTLLPKMLKKKKGNIIIVSSAASNVKGAPNQIYIWNN